MTTKTFKAKAKKQILQQIYRSSVSRLEELLERYGLTGNDYHWNETKKQKIICDAILCLK
jgi:hypothetical protein